MVEKPDNKEEDVKKDSATSEAKDADTKADTSKDNQSKDDSSKKTSNVDENNLKLISAVGYLGILFLVPMLMYPKEKFAMFHANQGLLLLICAVGLNILMPIIGFVTLGIGLFLYPLMWLFLFILFVLGLVNAFNGKMKRLPLIGGFDLIKVQE